MAKYTKNYFERINWEEYGVVMEEILKKVRSYTIKNKVKIDAVVPILRGGTALGIFLAYRLHLLRILPV